MKFALTKFALTLLNLTVPITLALSTTAPPSTPPTIPTPLIPPTTSLPTTSPLPTQFNNLVLPTYGRYDIGVVTRASGTSLYTRSPSGAEKKYLDFVSGIATNSFGHNNPTLTNAIKSQMNSFAHLSNLYYAENQALLAQWLLSNSFSSPSTSPPSTGRPTGKVFFCNSGAEANEGAIKLLRKHGSDNLSLTHPYIITMNDSFHGRTTGALAATNSGGGKYQKGFEFNGSVNAGFVAVPYNDIDALAATVKRLNRRSPLDRLRGIRRGVAGVMLETLQGEGGVKPADDNYLADVRALTNKHNALLHYDEVQTGIGRCGKLWNYQNYDGDVAPDVITSAKGIGGGMIPLGAMIMKDEAASVFTPGTHASTFGGNGLAVAGALAVAEILSDGTVFDNVNKRGEEIRTRLEEIASKYPDVVGNVRGRGLLLGVETLGEIKAMDLVARAMERGLLLVPAGLNIVRIVPPLTVSGGEVEEAMDIFEEAVKELV